MDKKEPFKNSSFSVLESIALEIESVFREMRAVLLHLKIEEKTAIVCSLVMFVSCFLPWFSASFAHTQSGADGFGTVHFGIAASTLFLVRRLFLGLNFHSAGKLGQSQVSTERRFGLILLGLGALSTATCIFLLLHFGDLAASSREVNVRYGFYLILTSGLGISASGFAKFL